MKRQTEFCLLTTLGSNYRFKFTQCVPVQDEGCGEFFKGSRIVPDYSVRNGVGSSQSVMQVLAEQAEKQRVAWGAIPAGQAQKAQYSGSVSLIRINLPGRKRGI